MPAASIRIVVDRARCTGMGNCESVAPRHFEVGDDGVLILLANPIVDADRQAIDSAVHGCPAKALQLRAVDAGPKESEP